MFNSISAAAACCLPGQFSEQLLFPNEVIIMQKSGRFFSRDKVVSGRADGLRKTTCFHTKMLQESKNKIRSKFINFLSISDT